MKIKTSQISLNIENLDEKLLRLEGYEGFKNLEIIDESNSNKFKITVPVTFRGESITFKIQCLILIKKEIRTTEIEIYSNLLKPLIIAFLIGTGIGTLTYLFRVSWSFSVFMFFVAFFFSGGMILNQIIKQTRSKISRWIK